MSTFPAPLPHGPLTRVADGVHAVRGGFKMGPGMTISRTMTILDTGEGLVILNAIRLSDEGQAELDAVGKVKHLVKLSDSHEVDEPFYADHYSAETWTLPGAKLGGLSAGRTLGPDSPVTGGVVIDFAETAGWREAAVHVPLGGGTLVTCDAIQNCADTEGASFGGRMMMSIMGFKGGVVVPPMWRRFQKVTGSQVSETLAPVADVPFVNLVTGHGPPVSGGADAPVREAIERASA